MENVKAKRMATCHPEQAHKAKGLCNACYYQHWSDENPDIKRQHHLKRHYDIEPEEYDFLLAVQGGICAICNKPPGDNLLCVDHDHGSDVIRGLLCHNCNKGIGLLGDSIESVEKALRYLKSSGSN